jgi:hypothetical protein
MQLSKFQEGVFIQFTPSQLLSSRIPLLATKIYGSTMLVPEFPPKWKIEGKTITYSPTDCCKVGMKCWEGYPGFLATWEEHVDLVLRLLFYLAADHKIVINVTQVVFFYFSVFFWSLRGRRE